MLWPLIARARSFLAQRKRVAGPAQRLLDRLPRLQGAVLALALGDPRARYETWIAAYDTVDHADLASMREHVSKVSQPTLLSLLVPVSHANESMLEALARSLLGDVYESWEVQFFGHPVVDEGVAAFLKEAPSRDARLRSLPDRERSLADGWNAALRSATSEFVVLVDPRVELRPHALFLLAYTIARNPDLVLIYADDDVIDDKGFRSDHYFKPDWNEALLRSRNYLGGLVCFRRSCAMAVGGFHEELDEDCAWGLFLRMTAGVPRESIHHLPFILSHRRSALAPANPEDGERRQRVARAHEQRLARIGEFVEIEPVGEASYRTRYAVPKATPMVSVIVPSTCNLEFLRPCLDGILNRTSHRELELLVIINGIRETTPAQREYLEGLAAETRVRTLFYNETPFNFSKTNNWGAEHASGELLCFLNDDTDVIGSEWLSAMVARVLEDRVGVVGAMLFYPNDRIQHAGVLLGVGGVAIHAYRGRSRDVRGYNDRALVDQDVSCVTAACMLVRREAFASVGGFDATLAIAFNDVDLCLRLREAGWRILWTPSAELYHKESASIGRHDTGDREDEWTLESSLIRNRWGAQLTSDPHYSHNLSLDPWQVWEPAFPPRVAYPWRARSSTRTASVEALTVRPSGPQVGRARTGGRST
jgi:GT2 family glycosyltransferase